jgi:hypothetical protein
MNGRPDDLRLSSVAGDAGEDGTIQAAALSRLRRLRPREHDTPN